MLGKGNSEDFILYRVLRPRTPLNADPKQLDFHHQLGKPITQPFCPTATRIVKIIQLSPQLYHRPAQSSGQTLRPSSSAPCRGSHPCKGNQGVPYPKEREAGSPCGASNPVRRLRSLPSPLSANTPRSFRNVGFLPLSCLKP